MADSKDSRKQAKKILPDDQLKLIQESLNQLKMKELSQSSSSRERVEWDPRIHTSKDQAPKIQITNEHGGKQTASQGQGVHSSSKFGSRNKSLSAQSKLVKSTIQPGDKDREKEKKQGAKGSKNIGMEYFALRKELVMELPMSLNDHNSKKIKK